jgi:hypothetical protein
MSMEVTMQLRMSERELRLFEDFLKCSSRYLEFGSGGSTCLAARLVQTSIVSIDSSEPWLQNIEKYCVENKVPTMPDLFHINIGQTGDWGYPTDPRTREIWPTYHRYIWTNPAGSNIDLCLIDGRFRVACFMQAILHGNEDVLIAFHDFRSRKHYHIVREVAREVATAEDLSIFLPLKGKVRERALQILGAFEFESS